MKITLPLFLFVFAISAVCQVPNINDIPITDRGTDYTLINDYKNLVFDQKNAKITFDFISEDTSGTIEGLDFKINFNPNDTDNASFSGTAKVSTLSTGNFLRDGHLMWEKFFHKRKYPTIAFKSSQVVDFEGNTFKVIGDVTIKGVTKELIITFKLDDEKLSGTASLYTSDYGVNIHDEREKNKLNIQFHFPIER
ncbi:YceI family protein [Aquimarina spongiae]|uniref:Polyisoprenoid-binding protein YceI n=1 Tax=Aquimarina spongiae TaxID=570521 RepID=A0A1M6B8R8_9FLAO|nr:YceI family protein [Aquimarina spongiae]SHI44968.1 Polyisoprenoid-binding protein YceI [Aquimarina spongiae]